MLALATLADGQTQEYEDLINNDELRHPLLASLRVRVQLKKRHEVQDNTTESSQTQASQSSQTQDDATLSCVVVEAMPCTFTDIPNDMHMGYHGGFQWYSNAIPMGSQ